jgi:superfamily II DNA or RNA helicase
VAHAVRIRAQIDSHIRLPLSDLPGQLREAICSSLTFPNPERETAKSEKVWRWEDVPTHVALWREEDDVLVLPRGFAARLRRGLQSNGFTLEWDDRMISQPEDLSHLSEIRFGADRDYQGEAVDTLWRTKQGIWMAPPGAGKTVGILELVRRCGQRTAITVNKSEIARQWIERSKTFLNYEPGLVGDGEFDVREITICMQQTLWSRRQELQEEGWFDQFGMFVGDEIHHWQAHTHAAVVQLFPAMRRVGVSATPDRENGYFPVVLAVMGDIVHKTPKDILQDRGILVRPSLEVMRTEFRFPFHGTFTVDADDECPIDGCDRQGKDHRHQNNYQPLLHELVHDLPRNEQIAMRICRERGRSVLVNTRRIAHVHELARLITMCGWPADRVFTMTSEQDSAERQRIGSLAEQGDVVIISTLAEEAWDVPRLDMLVLCWPTRSVKAVEQLVGRVERSHPSKRGALVVDVLDHRVPVLRGQFSDRRRGVYARQHFPIMDVGARASKQTLQEQLF